MSRRALQIAVAILVLFGAGFVSQITACSCLETVPPCQAYWDSPVVFVGIPLSVSQIVVESNGHKQPQRLFRFEIEEAFRGVEGTTLEVVTGQGGGDCGYDFRLRTKYLVYGDRQAGVRWVGASLCSRTRVLSDASEDLIYIRSIPKQPSGGSIYGTAERYAVDLGNGRWNPAGPIAGAVVVAESSERRFEAVTRSDGHYTFSGLPPGKYTVRATLPPKLSPAEEKTVEIVDRGCSEINYRAVTDGRISGRLLDVQAQPLGIKVVDLLPIEPGGKPLRSLYAITKEDGSFLFTNLPPGHYILGIRIGNPPDKDLPYRKTFYQSTSEQSKAEILSLGEGEHRSGIDFRLARPLIPCMVQGTVVWPDGRPAIKAEVSLTDVESGRLAGWFTKTDDKGHFALAAFVGVRYKIAATIPADPNLNPDSGKSVALLITQEVEITPSAQEPPVRLLINVDGDGKTRTRSTVGPRTDAASKRRKP